MSTVHRSVVVVALGMALLALPLVQAGTSAVSGTISTAQPVSLVGSGETRLSQGVVHSRIPGEALEVAELDAENLTIEVSEWEGDYVRRPGQDAIVEHGPVWKTTYRNLTNVSADGQPFVGPPEILILLHRSDAVVTSVETTHSMAEIIVDRKLTSVEYSNDSYKTDSREHGFSYHVDGPWPGVLGLDEVTINGTFTAFINNVTLSGTSDQGDWEHWTGRQEDPHPGGMSGGFESRVTFLHVEDGALTFGSPDGIELIGPSTEAEVDGIVSAQAATGRLQIGDMGVDLADEVVQLRGHGKVELSAASDGAQVNGAPVGSEDRLLVRPSGNFDVRAGPENLSTAGTLQAPPSDALGWEALAVVGLLVVGLLAWTGRTWMVELRDKVALEVRERRISSWRATGDRLCEAHRYDRAAVWYRRVVDRYPESAEAWHSLAEALEYDDRPSEASQAYERVSDRLGGDAYELVRAAKCAVKAGEMERAVGLLVEAGGMEPQTVRQALVDPVLTGLRGRPGLAAWVGDGADDTRSYA